MQNYQEKLSPDRWLVSIDQDTKELYSRLKEEESKFIEMCENAGLSANFIEKRCVILVPEGCSIPSFDKVLNKYALYNIALKNLAKDQGKEATIGDRVTSKPKWLSGDNYDQDRPSYNVNRIRYRTNVAYSSAELSPDEALEYLQSLLSKAEERVQNCEKYRKQKERIEAIGRVEQINISIDKLKGIFNSLPAGEKLSIRRLSGKALKLNCRLVDGVNGGGSIEKTASNFLFIPVESIDDCEVVEAPTRSGGGRWNLIGDFERLRIMSTAPIEVFIHVFEDSDGDLNVHIDN